MKVLLVEPEYKQAGRTKHEAKLCPVGLFKHYFYHIEKGDSVRIVRGCILINSKPDLIKITSLFTYWSDDVFQTIKYYKTIFPETPIKVGGILASLIPEIVKKQFPDITIHEGIDRSVEDVPIDWFELNRTIQIIHASRSCMRNCKFCGVRKIEPEISYKTWKQVKAEIQLNDIVFFDNNFLMNPHHKEILQGIAQHKVNGKVIHSEAQSGFDPRLITEENATLLKKARFRSIRISWDHSLDQAKIVKQALTHLEDAGFNSKNIGIFMIYNWDNPFDLMELKRKICFDWNVQIFDCRYRPLDQLFDNYNPYKTQQTSEDYYIHPAWTDEKVRKFRRNVRRQNIMIRFNFRTEEQMDEWIKSKRKTSTLLNRKLTLKSPHQTDTKQLALINQRASR
ncbi:Fe-S oxidoreductase [bacterium]|nr:Fe-S oxidoreductase [bacterium]